MRGAGEVSEPAVSAVYSPLAQLECLWLLVSGLYQAVPRKARPSQGCVRSVTPQPLPARKVTWRCHNGCVDPNFSLLKDDKLGGAHETIPIKKYLGRTAQEFPASNCFV